MDFFRKIFGFDDSTRFSEFNNQDYRDEYKRDHEQNGKFNRKGFDVFSDPFQMHQFFEQEMNSILKSFGLQNFDSFFSDFDSRSNLDRHFDESSTQTTEDLRDQFLKPGYDKPAEKYTEKIDKDLDDRVKNGNIDAILGDNQKQEIVTPFMKNGPQTFFFGSSQSKSTISYPDGTMETKQSRKDHDGNEETITCKIFGEKQYCVIKKKTRDGKEETTEQYVNMDENEKDKIFHTQQKNINDDPIASDFPFDRFFR